MLHRAQEGVGLPLEVVDSDPGERDQHAAKQRAHIRIIAPVVLGEHRGQSTVVALVSRLPRLAIT
jgi:hypothetical protein